ncbi:MAG: heme-binding domain-containing protein [Acidobacteria bacterium]|nr:heme-binding domain-containing protein [Acidobacteriota bacterium]
MIKVLKAAAAFLLLLFVGAQFVRPARVNPTAAAGQSLEEHARVPGEVADVLQRSCMDCHSNRTDWPWYSNVAPVSWFVIDHVNHGRRYLNFSRWGEYDRRDRIDHLNAICKTVKGGSMPLDSYTLVHRGTKLGPADVKTLCDWAGAEQRRLASSEGKD